eukprot:CAMPEP_0115292592 /NCGR_PEP_ID=MMETSP0270-20121206/65215_1 /TAXON_ID=71861 /ORGANISM="Scrippsiella trochoidea, Strain CCMP3099" /LENGTH=308 /DNA_ID=CAMNT_0002710029 /DNA_START=74 /DNA_END=1000 /DNA_ORIENTATION=-
MAPRGFCIGLALAAAATSVPVTDAQFLRGVFATSSSSSSYFSSSTWTLGQDGEMHEKVKKMSSEVVETPHGPQRVEKKMVCKDGNCREEMMIQSARNPEAEAMIPPPHFGMGYHARQIMTRLMGRVHSPPPPVIEVVAVPGPAPELKPEIVEMAPPDASRGMALRGMLQQLVGPPTKHGIVEAVPLQPRISNPYVSISHSMARSAAIGCLIVCSVFLATIVAVLRLQGAASARELPMRGALAEPLASAEGAAPKGPAAPAVATKAKEEDCALNSTRVYLKDLYDQVIAKAENQAIAQYLSTVYARATA